MALGAGSGEGQAKVVIVGGGVVGCAVASVVSKRWDDVFLLEQMPKVGMGASSRNSGVIHSGLYYTPGSLKARHCVAGNRLTYEFCAAHRVPNPRNGKLVVAAAPEEEDKLAELVERGSANGVQGLRILGREAIRTREPHITGHAAIEVLSTGLVASEELVKAYARVAADQGANVLTHAHVERLEPEKDFVRVWIRTGGSEAPLEGVVAATLVNCAGLFADEVAALAGNNSYRIYPVRGEYCEMVRSKSHLIHALVYPLPHPEGLSLGLHFTKTLWGTILVGPTARYVQGKDDYEHDLLPVEEFARGIQQGGLLPGIEPADLVPAYSGLRAKLVPPGGKGPADFVIARDPSYPYITHLVGIESPGLTAAPSIAEQVSQMIAETLG